MTQTGMHKTHKTADHPTGASPRARTLVTLREFEWCEAELPNEACAILRHKYAGKLDVMPTERLGVYRLVARHYVGCIGLPGGITLVIRPKIPVSNLFYMLWVDAGLADLRQPPVGLTPDADILTVVLHALVEGVQTLLRQGLYRAFIPLEEDLPLVRGRVALEAQVRRYGQLRHRHICRYAHLTADTPENRVVVAALHVAHALLRTQTLTPAGLAHRARRLLAEFEGVEVLSRGAALATLRGISVHRLNAGYAPVLALCRLVLSQLSLDETPGPACFASFLVNMPVLFERFLTVQLSRFLPAHGLRVVAQHRDYLDIGGRVGIRPDVLVYPRHGDVPVLVLDAKYRAMTTGPDRGGPVPLSDDLNDLNRDLYQISAYLDRFKLNRGVLVYPRTGMESVPTDMCPPGPDGLELRLKGTNKRLRLATLDLNSPDPATLDERCALLAELVAQIVNRGQ